MPEKTLQDLRSRKWYADPGLRAFGHRSRTLQMGYSRRDFENKPVIAILNTWSDINPCHTHFKQRVEDVKRGVLQGGGFPLEMPVMSLSEPFVKPTAMLYRNLLAMEVEETLRSLPFDGVVLMGGCDKTTPALIMGATSAGLPSIFVPAGPMLRGNWRGKILGSGSDTWKYWADKRAGLVTDEQWTDIEDNIARSPGHCMTMGTASTMTSVAEALGMTLPGAVSIPAVDSNHTRMASDSGRRVVEMVWQDLKPTDILTEAAFRNAITVYMAIGGSTNGIIHLVAMARRAGLKLELEAFDEISRRTPVIANIRPSGAFLMEDFFYAGGLRALMSRLGDLLDLSSVTANGRTLGENIATAEVFDTDVIRSLDNPVSPNGGIAVLRGNLAPSGAVIKPAAAEPQLWRHVGPALVFKDRDDMEARIDDPELPVTADSVVVLQNAGPLGGPGMPEWGQLPIPKKLLQQGVRDMVRISDSRMSGTSYGACVLHVSPESFIGGPLALVRDGDLIELDVPGRRLHLHVGDAELAARRQSWQAPPPRYARGYGAIFSEHVLSADQGCDFDVLARPGHIPEPAIY